MFDKQKFMSQWNGTHMYQWMGLSFVDISDDGWVTLQLNVQDHHRGGGGTDAVNGAVIAYLFDLVSGVAVRAGSQGRVRRQATISLNMQYLELAAAKEKLFAKGKAVRLGNTLAFVESMIITEDGTVCATSSGEFRIFRMSESRSEIKQDLPTLQNKYQ